MTAVLFHVVSLCKRKQKKDATKRFQNAFAPTFVRLVGLAPNGLWGDRTLDPLIKSQLLYLLS